MRPFPCRTPLPRCAPVIAALLLAPLTAPAAAPRCTAPDSVYASTYARPAAKPAQQHNSADDLLSLTGIGSGVTHLLGDGSRWVGLNWLTLRANRGNPAAQYEMGVRRALGIGFGQNETRAAQWFKLAAEQGDVRAGNDLGVLYAEGRGVPQSYGNAEHWFARAARKNFAAAQFNLGVMFARGRGVPLAPSLAAVWFRRAAEQGFVPAQLALGDLLDEGAPGLRPDLPTAYFWQVLAKAALPAHDPRAACLLPVMQALESRLSTGEIEYAQRAAQSWWRYHLDARKP
ncbi:MAG: sel1 repeat family protein [Proteobacteria bacterium]|nr:sel1 repeat family protein [Pseudomonadota bacterium]